MTVTEVLRAHHSDILREWEAGVRQLPRAAPLGRLELMDLVPTLLEYMRSVFDGEARSIRNLEVTALEHGAERLDKGLDLREVVAEFRVLRRVVLRCVLQNADPVSADQLVLLEGLFDSAIQESIVSYVGGREQELRLAKEQLRAILDNAPTVVFIKDREGRYQFINRHYAEVFGLDRERALGRTDAELLPYLEPAVREHDEWVLTRGEPLAVEEHVPVKGERRDWWSIKFPLPGGESFCGIATDITDRKRMEEAREQFVAILGHDLRTPLGVIRMAAEALMKDEGRGQVDATLVKRILSSSDRITRMTDEVLDFARGKLGGGIPIRRALMDMGRVCERVLGEIRIAHENSQIGLTREGDLTGSWDSDRVAQVITNLVVNALQHGQGDVAVHVQGQPDFVELSVSNRGPVISPEQLEHIFEPYRRGTKHGIAREGLGLGLFIVREIVTAHRGTVSVRSTEKEGTRFTTVWPRE